MTTQDRAPGRWANLPVSLRAVISGLLITLAAVNVWPLLLLNLGVPLAAFAEAIFLGLFLWWTGGGGPSRTTQAARATAFRRGRLSPTQWFQNRNRCAMALFDRALHVTPKASLFANPRRHGRGHNCQPPQGLGGNERKCHNRDGTPPSERTQSGTAKQWRRESSRRRRARR